MEFCCSVCNYTSETRENVVRHISKKNKCGENPIVNSRDIDIICDFCNKSFTIKSNLTRHLKTCKVKKINLEKELAIRDEKVKELEKKLAVSEALNKKPSTNIGTQNNTNINIQLAPWNNPMLPEDVEKYYQQAVKKIFLAVPTLIKYIHFNSEHPENHNICIKNARNKTAKVYNGKEWESIDEDTLIRNLIDDYEHTLEDYAEENAPKYNKKIKEIKDRDSEEKVYDDLHNEVKRVIYDRNHMIKVNK
jgi:hypothetical protein